MKQENPLASAWVENSCADNSDHDTTFTPQIIEPQSQIETGSRERQPSQRDQLIACAATWVLWSDRVDAYASITINNRVEHYAIRSSALRERLINTFLIATDKAPSTGALSEAIATLEAIAKGQGIIHKPALRVGETAGKVYLDLCDATWRVVEIDDTGWRVISNTNCPVRFLRKPAMLPLPAPVARSNAGALEEMRDQLNVNRTTWYLLLSALVDAFRPNTPKPVVRVSGEQGSGKTTLLECCRRLIDPSQANLRSLPKEERDLMISLDNAYILAFDNVSKIPD
jgi:hypothetical protein